VINRLLVLVSWLVAAVLLIFTARRWLFTFAALWSNPSTPDKGRRPSDLPDVLLLAPVRNEAQLLPEFLTALNRLDYPGEQLTLVFIDDGSTDGSGQLLRQETAGRANRYVLSLPQNLGKAEALNFALRTFPQGDIVAVYDADERPQPDALRLLVSAFDDAAVGGVSGRRAIVNAQASPAASYIAVEGLVHQLVTMRAKDRLGLAPAILGANCAYRRSALAQIGNFRPGALLEDTDLTVKLARSGWRTRFVALAVSYHQAPITLPGYWRQHARWARGFNEMARAHGRDLVFDYRLSPTLRLELLLFALGYLDRLAILGGGLLWLLGRAGRPLIGVLALSLLTPIFQMVAALKIAQAPPSLWARLGWVPLFFGLDLAMAAAGFWRTLIQAPQVWEERRARV
jgi:cellulose synthase/poly-beta-1,6-N-acetylglucosamine synthase-like glycosyltransferase